MQRLARPAVFRFSSCIFCWQKHYSPRLHLRKQYQRCGAVAIQRFFNNLSSSQGVQHKNDNDESYNPRAQITFLTDVEGDGLYFDRFIHHSKVLGFRSTSPSFGQSTTKIYYHDEDVPKLDSGEVQNYKQENVKKLNYGHYDEEYFPYDKEVVFLDDDSIFVYGGDVWDKGGFDLYVMRQLLSLRMRYPTRVFFLMGNRDINKMRIVDELGGVNERNHNMGSTILPKHEGVYWLLRGLMSTDPKPSIPSNSPAERLKWMLTNTMGSTHAFEFRWDELRRERIAFMNESSVTPSDHSFINGTEDYVTISDDEVAQSYITSCCPVSGLMSHYLMHAKLVIRLGSVLILHGALPIDSKIDADDHFNHFPTPWLRPSSDSNTASGLNSLAEWIDALNSFFSSQVKAWKEFGQRLPQSSPPISSEEGVWATKGGYFNNTRAGKMFSALMQYGMGRLVDNATTQSCVYSSWMHDGLPRNDIFGYDKSMKIFSRLLKKEGIQLILTGHRPVGDAPWLIKIPPSDGEQVGAWVLPCDTSYSGDTRWMTVDGSVPFDSRSLGRGLAKSGRGEVAFSEENLLCGKSCGPFAFKDLESGEFNTGMLWVKAKVGDNYLVSYGKGYNVWNSFINPHSIISGGRA